MGELGLVDIVEVVWLWELEWLDAGSGGYCGDSVGVGDSLGVGGGDVGVACNMLTLLSLHNHSPRRPMLRRTGRRS